MDSMTLDQALDDFDAALAELTRVVEQVAASPRATRDEALRNEVSEVIREIDALLGASR